MQQIRTQNHQIWLAVGFALAALAFYWSELGWTVGLSVPVAVVGACAMPILFAGAARSARVSCLLAATFCLVCAIVFSVAGGLLFLPSSASLVLAARKRTSRALA